MPETNNKGENAKVTNVIRQLNINAMITPTKNEVIDWTIVPKYVLTRMLTRLHSLDKRDERLPGWFEVESK